METRNEINIIYDIKKCDKKEGRIKIFGKDFIKNNKNKCKIIINEKENELIKEINKEINKKNNKNSYKKIYKDIIASSETGTGKTISYLIPIINTLIKNGPPKQKENEITKVYPLTLIILPTRELVEQVFKESKKLCFKIGINTIKIYGGINYDIQLLSLSQGCDILICTPGRLIDYLKIGIISLKYINFFILDEADKLLDMGFEKQLNSIIFDYDLIDKSFRNNFLFSATFNESVIKIIRKFMNDYYFIQICDKEINFIKQEFIFIKNEEKNKKIFELLKKYFNTKIIIFTNTKLNSENLFNLLKNDKNYFNIDLINGNKNQNERKKTIENFYNNKINILIATDIIGRGLDFPNVDLIINYDIPNSKEDYIHRIGRSGRMGNKGMSITFIDNLNNLVLKDIILLLNKNNIDIPNWMKNINFDNFVNNVNLKKKNKKKKKKERSRSKDL